MAAHELGVPARWPAPYRRAAPTGAPVDVVPAAVWVGERARV
jgi:hypothetical protein